MVVWPDGWGGIRLPGEARGAAVAAAAGAEEALSAAVAAAAAATPAAAAGWLVLGQVLLLPCRVDDVAEADGGGKRVEPGALGTALAVVGPGADMLSAVAWLPNLTARVSPFRAPGSAGGIGVELLHVRERERVGREKGKGTGGVSTRAGSKGRA